MRFIKSNVRTIICVCALMISMITALGVLINTALTSDPVIMPVVNTDDKVSLDVNWIEENTMKLNPIDAFEVIDVNNVRINEDTFFADLTFYLNRQYKEWNRVGLFENRYAFHVLIEDEQLSNEYSLYLNDEDKLRITIHETIPDHYMHQLYTDEVSDFYFVIVFEDVKGGFTQTFTIPIDEIAWGMEE